MRARVDPRERLMKRVKVAPSGCWEWQGFLTFGGYGQMVLDGVRMNAHRAAWIILRGPVAPGLDVDHLCRNRRCVNPDHLEPVTRSENLRRGDVGGWQSRITHCPAGHPYDAANTYHRPDGGRECRACRRTARLAYYYRTKERKVA